MDKLTINFGHPGVRDQTGQIVDNCENVKNSSNSLLSATGFPHQKPDAEKWRMWMVLINRSGKQMIRNLVDISGPHSYHQITFSAICQNEIFYFRKIREIEALVPEPSDLLREGL